MRKGLNEILFILTLMLTTTVNADDIYQEQAKELVREVEKMFYQSNLTDGLVGMSPAVKRALFEVPRHKFVPPKYQVSAYENRPLPIGYGQTISQPFIVALMSDIIRVNLKSKVLEIGTGSGYQAAILSQMVEEVYTIEIIPALAKRSKALLTHLGYKNITVKEGDGYYGISQHAPYDAIVVTAAAGHIPAPLIKQLKVGGRMIIPVGKTFGIQYLILIEKTKTGVTSKNILPVRFVPLTGTR